MEYERILYMMKQSNHINKQKKKNKRERAFFLSASCSCTRRIPTIPIAPIRPPARPVYPRSHTFGQRIAHLVAANDGLHGQMIVDRLLVGLGARQIAARCGATGVLGQRHVAGLCGRQRRRRTVGIVAEVRVPGLQEKNDMLWVGFSSFLLYSANTSVNKSRGRDEAKACSHRTNRKT